jgi:hypothetical protein
MRVLGWKLYIKQESTEGLKERLDWVPDRKDDWRGKESGVFSNDVIRPTWGVDKETVRSWIWQEHRNKYDKFNEGFIMGAVTALAVLAAGSAVFGGLQARDAAKEQSALAIQQSQAAATETKRQTDRSVELENRNIKDVTDRQRLAFLASGVTLEGSPLLKLEETRRLGAENIEEIQKAGDAGSAAQLAEGRMTAQQAKSKGRQALTQGIVGAAGSLSRLA